MRTDTEGQSKIIKSSCLLKTTTVTANDGGTTTNMPVSRCLAAAEPHSLAHHQPDDEGKLIKSGPSERKWRPR